MIKKNFSNLSIKLTNDIDKKNKKNDGIFFTPQGTINNNIELLEPYMKNIKKVLEPSCGSCEFINLLINKYPHLDIIGIEYNKTIYDAIKDVATENIKLYNEDYLKFKTDESYDLIIGNPPYYVMKKGEVDNEYYDYFNGRPNIFILFIVKSLKMLNNNGILSFVLPKSFLNCLYYDKTRKHINDNYKIVEIIDCDSDYIDTQQETIIIIIQKTNDEDKVNKVNKVNNDDFILNMNDYIIFNIKSNIKKLKNLLENSTTLNEIKFTTKVGNVVWNQCKDKLTDDDNKTLLIYNSNLSKDNNIEIKNYNNKEKKNYIDKKGLTGPILLLNRGYGVGKYVFQYCLYNEKKEYLIENHLISINYNDGEIQNDEKMKLYEKIIKSFNNKKTKDFIDLYFGNSAINTTELNYILPIYDF